MRSPLVRSVVASGEKTSQNAATTRFQVGPPGSRRERSLIHISIPADSAGQCGSGRLRTWRLGDSFTVINLQGVDPSAQQNAYG
jgi:hypothetical protein